MNMTVGELRITLTVDYENGPQRGTTSLEIVPRPNLTLDRLHTYLWDEVQRMGRNTGVKPVAWRIQYIRLGRMDILKSNCEN